MPSPFPGMDPFLEDQRFFPDLHGRFHIHLSELLQSLLPAPYFAVVNERLLVEVEDEYQRHIEPDTDVIVSESLTDADSGGAVAVSFRLEETLPEIAVPLLSRDGFVPLDLQVVFNRCYDAGPYRRRLRYDVQLLDPALNPKQREWAGKLLQEIAPA